MNALTLNPPITSAVNLPSTQRMEILHRLNSQAGYTAPKTIFPEGTALIDIGEQNLSRVKTEVAALPSLSAFSQAFLEAEKMRDPRDITDSLTALRMLPGGKLSRRLPTGEQGPAIGYTPTGLAQCVGAYRELLGLPNGFVGSLEWLSPEKARPEAFNDLACRAQLAAGKWSNAERTNPFRAQRVYRTSVLPTNGERYLYAVTSPKHVGAAGGFAAMVRQLTSKLPNDAKVRVTHQGHDRLDVEVLFPMMAREIRVGDVLWASVSVTLSESKDVSASVADGLMRVLCVNLTRANYGKETHFTRKHIGERNFTRDIMARIAEGAERIVPFIQAFGDAYVDTIPGTRPEIVERVGKRFPDAAKVLTGEVIMGAWDMDGPRSAGNTRGGLVNALTRASQSLGITDAQLVEDVAGQIVTGGWAALA